jgi:hypothetical protein
LRHLHVATAGATLIAQYFEHGLLLCHGEPLQIDARQRVFGFPILRQQEAAGQKKHTCQKANSPQKERHKLYCTSFPNLILADKQ